MRDTIFALATAPGRAAVAIIRISGPAARFILLALSRKLPEPRKAALRQIHGADGELLDEGLVLWFPGPSSFTGEDLFELQLHGGAAIISGVADALLRLGARAAEPGEFTRRAFEADRLDLSQAEAVADLVDAETAAQRRQALSQLGGGLARRGEAWRETLLNTLAFLGAQIDFPDEDLPTDVVAKALNPLAALRLDIQNALEDTRGERVREGLKIALVGAPNAGKSSLLNALIERDASIVTSIPGATRDVIEAPLMICGYKVLLADTAGLRHAIDEVEIEGVRRAKAWAAAADLRLWVLEPGPTQDPGLLLLAQSGDILVLSKSDRMTTVSDHVIAKAQEIGLQTVRTSVRAADGLGELKSLLERWVLKEMSGASAPSVTRARHRVLLTQAHRHLTEALAGDNGDWELVSENIRLTAQALEQLSGRIDPEDVLDRVFGSFCIGK